MYFLDFETRSRLDLPKEGLDNYVNCPDFDAIVVALSGPGGRVRLGTNADDDLPSVRQLLEPVLASPSSTFVAHNAGFEYAVCCKLAERWGLPQPALSRFYCTSAMGVSVGLPAGLDKLANTLLQDAKVESGKALMKLFCAPNKRGVFNNPKDFREDWATFLAYARKDVQLTRQLWKVLPKLRPLDRRYWLSVTRMNFKGFAVDMDTVRLVLNDIELIKADAVAVTKAVTKGLVSKPTERKKLLTWLNDRGYAGESLTSETVTGWLRDDSTPEDIKDLLWARLSASKSTFGKYAAFERYVSADGRSRHGFVVPGTHTGRLAGKGVQPQNIAYDKDGRYPKATEMLELYRKNQWPKEWDRTEALVAMTRAVIRAPKGKKFYVVDYASIEARISAWLANVAWALAAYRKGEDLYKPMAAIIFGIRVDEVTKEQRNRYGKVTVLGGQYGMGIAKFSKQYNLPEHEAKRCVYAYRNTYSQIKTYWSILEEAFRACLLLKKSTKAQADGGPAVRFRYTYLCEVPYVVCTPPGGREIWYRNPKIDTNTGDLSYERITAKSKFRNKLWGGILLENICQNIAGVIISHGTLNAERRGLVPALQIHDELVGEINEGTDTIKFDKAMVEIESFSGLPIAVESHVCERFGK